MVTFDPRDDFTGEGHESEVWIQFHGEHEGRESEIVVVQYPYSTGDQAYAAAKRNADKLTEAWERLVKGHPDSDLDDLIIRLGDVAGPMWKDFRS